MTGQVWFVILMFLFYEIQAQGQKPQMSVQHFDGDQVLFTCLLPGSVKDNTRCILYFGEAIRRVLTTTVLKKNISKTQQKLCQFYVPIDDFLIYLHFVQQKIVSCEYSLESEPNSLSPRSDGYSVKDILERESPMTSTNSSFNVTTDILDRQSSMTSTKSSFHVTTELSLTTHHANVQTTSINLPPESVPANLSRAINVTSAVKTTENLASMDDITESTMTNQPFTTTTIGQTLQNPDSEVSPPRQNPTSEALTWKLVIGVTGFGVIVGVILLVLVLHTFKRRTGVENEKWKKTTNDDSDIYHIYATISEEPAASASQDMTYSMLQAH